MKEEKTYAIIRVERVMPEDTARTRGRNQTTQAVAQMWTLTLSSQSNEGGHWVVLGREEAVSFMWFRYQNFC